MRRVLFSPLTRDGQLLSLSSAYAAGGNFRLVTKVTKGTPKREENRSVRFSSLLGTSHLSTDRGSPPRINARGLTDTLSQRGSRDVDGSTFNCPNCARITLKYRICEPPHACRAEAVRDRSKGRWVSREGGKPLRTVSFPPLMRFCLLLPHSKSRCLRGMSAS